MKTTPGTDSPVPRIGGKHLDHRFDYCSRHLLRRYHSPCTVQLQIVQKVIKLSLLNVGKFTQLIFTNFRLYGRTYVRDVLEGEGLAFCGNHALFSFHLKFTDFSFRILLLACYVSIRLLLA